MKIEVKIDENSEEIKAILVVPEMSEEVYELIQKLSCDFPNFLMGFKNGRAEILNYDEIFNIYSANSKIYAVTAKGEFALKCRLYELEERLDKYKFVRISNSEIINLKLTDGFDLSFGGTVRVNLKNGRSTYISRRYISKVKDILGF